MGSISEEIVKGRILAGVYGKFVEEGDQVDYFGCPERAGDTVSMSDGVPLCLSNRYRTETAIEEESGNYAEEEMIAEIVGMLKGYGYKKPVRFALIVESVNETRETIQIAVAFGIESIKG